MAMMIKDNVSLDNIEGDDALGDTYIIVPKFMPATQDNMWWFPYTPKTAGAATEAHAFHKTFSTSLHNLEKVWSLLDKEGLQPPDRCPKHLLWALHFMKCYPLQALGCTAVSASDGAAKSGSGPSMLS